MKQINEELYERIKDRNVTSVAKALYHDINVKGSKEHDIIGSVKMCLQWHISDVDEGAFPGSINYEQFRNDYERKFELHMMTLEKCLKAGFKI